MSRMWWIVILVGVGIAAAIAIGVLGMRNEPSKTDAVSSLCVSLKNLEASVKTLTGLDPSTATKTEYQTDVEAVKSDWSTTAPGTPSTPRWRTCRTTPRSPTR